MIIARIMLPEDANPAGIVHGGVVMKELGMSKVWPASIRLYDHY